MSGSGGPSHRQIAAGYRVCPKCRRSQPRARFSDGKSHCKDCRRTEHLRTLDAAADKLVRDARARNRGTCRRRRGSSIPDYSFDLTKEEVRRRVAAGRCEVTGIPWDLKRPAFRPSLDRKDPTRPYSLDNVAVVCWCYNRAKGNGSARDVLEMARALVKKEGA